MMPRPVLALAFVACAAHDVNVSPNFPDRSPDERVAADAAISVRCGYDGPAWLSGDDAEWYASERGARAVVTDARHMITAAHAVECPGIPEVTARIGRARAGRDGPDGKTRPARLDRFAVVAVDEARGLAELELLAAGPPLEIPEGPGSALARGRRRPTHPPVRVCFAVSPGGFAETCGDVGQVTSERVYFAATSQPGQSGVGVYDARSGALVGVLGGSVWYVDGSSGSYAIRVPSRLEPGASGLSGSTGD